MKPTARCGRCHYWKAGPTQGLAGECRRQPPVVLMFSDAPETHFPAANGDDWCGEFTSEPTCSGMYQVADHGMARCQRRIGHGGACGPLDAVETAVP